MSMLAESAATDAHGARGKVSRSPAPSGTLSGEYLTFRLGSEEYAMSILRVQEIRSYEPPTRVAGAPRDVRGVLNLRGTIVPVVDLRLRMGCDQSTMDASTVIIVLALAQRVVGAVVDAVSDVVRLGQEHIRQAPAMPGLGDDSGIVGIATLAIGGQDRMLVVVDIDALIDPERSSLTFA